MSLVPRWLNADAHRNQHVVPMLLARPAQPLLNNPRFGVLPPSHLRQASPLVMMAASG